MKDIKGKNRKQDLVDRIHYKEEGKEKNSKRKVDKENNAVWMEIKINTELFL